VAIADANTRPRFPLSGAHATDAATGMPQPITGASNSYDGTNANDTLIFTAGANGSVVRFIRCTAAGSNTTSVARVFINNGSTNATATNNTMIAQESLPAITAIATAATVTIDILLDEIELLPGWRLYLGLGTAVAAGWVCVAYGYDL